MLCLPSRSCWRSFGSSAIAGRIGSSLLIQTSGILKLPCLNSNVARQPARKPADGRLQCQATRISYQDLILKKTIASRHLNAGFYVAVVGQAAPGMDHGRVDVQLSVSSR